MLKKTIALLCCILALSAAAQNRIYIEDLTMTAGESAVVTVKMNEPSAVSAVQFNLTIPEGLTVATNNNGRPALELVPARVSNTDHAVSGSLNGSVMSVMVYSTTAKSLNMIENGDLLTFTVTADQQLEGSFDITVSDIVASSESLAEIKMTAGSGTITVTQPVPLAESITVEPESLTLTLNETSRLTAHILPENALPNVAWSSDDPSIVSVDDDGNITAVGIGATTIRVATTDGSELSAACEVTVIMPPAASIELNEHEISLNMSDSFQLSATVLPEDADQNVEWSSCAAEIVEVNVDGYVTALKPGVATITATTTDGSNLSASCEVTVLTPLVETITITPSEAELFIGEELSLEATVLPEFAKQELNWESSNPEVVTVDSYGHLHAVNDGEATITATATDDSGVSGICQVTVKRVQAESITLDRTELSLVQGATEQLTATVEPAEALQEVTWSSDDETIATVDDNGLVSAVAPGETVIRATTTDGTELSAECRITVTQITAESITLNKTEDNIVIGATTQLTATILPAEAAQTVAWSSSDDAIATVDVNGLVIGIAAGRATITATTTDGTELSATCLVEVTLPAAAAIELNKSETALKVGETEQLIATVSPELASQEVVWKSSDENIATVDNNGLVTAVTAGEAIISATTTDGSDLSAECKVTVTENTVPVAALMLAVNVPLNQPVRFNVTASPADATNPELSWTSDDESIATVEDGKVSGVALGSTVITVATTDGSNISLSIRVNVVEAVPGKLNDADVNNDGAVNTGDVSAVYDVIISGE